MIEHEPVGDERLPDELVCAACTADAGVPIPVGACVHARGAVAAANRVAGRARAGR